jgi:DNA-binding transcriptional ArsR family regulator
MPSEIEPATARRTVPVIVAPVFEVGFALFVVAKAAAGGRSDRRQAWVDPFFAAHPELVERIRTFWGDGIPTEWGELPLIADAAGVCFEPDPARAWGPMERVAAAGLRVPPLPVEEPGVDRLLQARIDLLSADAERRTAYFALLQDMWAALLPTWEGGGFAVATALAEHVRTELARQPDPVKVLPANHFARRQGSDEVVDAAIERGIMTIVPLGMGGAGTALFAFPNAVLAALGPDSEAQATNRREDAERAAAKFKLFSDPTRNLILGSLLTHPQSITELAEAFELSQPTISVHIKMLREAGLLDSVKVKGQTQYRAAGERLREHLAEAARLLSVCE